MIKIRYRDPNELPPGLHAAAERYGRSTTVYLLPGLSVAQRRAALRRLRISARRGQSPRLPAAQLALALAVDRVRTSVGRAGAVFRLHPAGSTVPVMVVSAGAIAFLALSAVSIQVIHHPRDPRPAGSLGEQSGPAGPGPSGGNNAHDSAGSGTAPAPGDTTAADPTTGSGTTLEGSAAHAHPGRGGDRPGPGGLVSGRDRSGGVSDHVEARADGQQERDVPEPGSPGGLPVA